MAHGGGRTNGLMRRLGFLLFLVGVRELRQILRAVLRTDVLAHFGQCFVRNPSRIGTHVSDESDQAFFAQFHAFVEPLGDHHGALYAEAQLARGVLLQLTGGEWRSCVAPPLLTVHNTDDPIGLLQTRVDLLRVLAVGNFDLLFTLAQKPGVECRRPGCGEICINRPVFLLLEGLNFALALYDQPQSDGLHPAGGQATPDLVPKQRRDLVTYEAVKDAARLLRIHQMPVNAARVFEGLAHSALRNLVEGDAADAFAFLFFLLFLLSLGAVTQLLGQVRSDGFAFAIRVRRQIDRIRGIGQLLELCDDFFFAGNDDVFRIEIIIDVDTEGALGQILDVTERGFDGETLTQIFLDGLRLGRRLDDD